VSDGRASHRQHMKYPRGGVGPSQCRRGLTVALSLVQSLSVYCDMLQLTCAQLSGYMDYIIDL